MKSVTSTKSFFLSFLHLSIKKSSIRYGGMAKGNVEVVQALELKDDEAIYGPILLGYPKVNPSPAVAAALKVIAPNKKEPRIKWI